VDGEQVMLGRLPDRFTVADNIDDSLQIGDPRQMVLHPDLGNIDVLLYNLIELLCRNLQQTIVLLDPVLESLLVVGEVLDQIGQIVDCGVVYREHIV
jgi:hypothetical protein